LIILIHSEIDFFINKKKRSKDEYYIIILLLINLNQFFLKLDWSSLFNINN
jgi:hypothetical protein